MKRYVALILICLWSGAIFSNEVKNKPLDARQEEMAAMLDKGFNEVKVGNPSIAIEKYLNPVIEYYEGKYSGQKVYCARTSQESLLYLAQAASDNTSAIVIEPTWAQAYFLKSYASLDLGRKDEANKWLNSALALSPANSGYNSELAHLNQLQMNWPEALALYKKAEEYANSFSPDTLKNFELLRAKRGIAYVLVEQGKLEEAKALYKECLAIDPNDEKSKGEIKYIQNLESKKSGKNS